MYFSAPSLPLPRAATVMFLALGTFSGNAVGIAESAFLSRVSMLAALS